MKAAWYKNSIRSIRASKRVCHPPMMRFMLASVLLLTIPHVVYPQNLPAAKAEEGPAFHSVPELETGFRLLYEQKFPEARNTFLAWERLHPGEPFAPIAVAASYLFEEFYRQGVLSGEFFLDDRKFLHGIDGQPNAERMNAFQAALK